MVQIEFINEKSQVSMERKVSDVLNRLKLSKEEFIDIRFDKENFIGERGNVENYLAKIIYDK